MKILSIFTPRSFASRMTRWVTLTVLVVMVLITWMIYNISKEAMAVEASERYQGMMTRTNLSVNNELLAVEVALSNNVPDIVDHLDNPDHMADMVDRILRLNPNIVGSAIAFAPGYYKSKGTFYAPYVYRTDSVTIRSKQLGNAQYNYPEKEWFAKPRDEGRPCWSDPYYDEGGGEMTMTTYSLPLFNSKGDMYAVLTADVSLDWLTRLLSDLDSVNNKNDLNMNRYSSYSFILGRNGNYIVHPDSNLILKKSFVEYTQQTPDTMDNYVAHRMLTGLRGNDELVDNNGSTSFFFYAPLERTGWSMAIVVPRFNVYFLANVLGVIILAIMAVGLVVVLFVCRKTVRRLTKPLTLFARSADDIASGNLNAPLPTIKSKDEMRRLLDSFSMMQTSLRNQMDELGRVNEQKGRIESELHIANEIQMSMLPKTFPPFPDRDDIDIYGELTPAKAVGGDLYDFYIRDEKLFFCIGDVSGKGVPAALVMAVTRSLFRTVSIHEAAPERIVMHMNEAMADQNDSNMFVTLFIGVLDLPTGRLRYCNAGHDAPLLIGRKMGFMPIEPNIPVGVMKGWKYVAQEVVVFPDTTIFLYTDGLTEATNADQKLFGQSRMMRAAQPLMVKGLHHPRKLIASMTEAVRLFVGEAEQSDDLTMLAIQYTRQDLDVRFQKSIVLKNDVQEVPRLSAFVDEVCEAVEFDMGTTMQMNLAIEEAVVNVISYAYPPGTQGNISLEAVANDQCLNFIITDAGTPFDPTAKAEVDTTLSAEERSIGGLGIHLVRQLMDSINYERIDGKNVLTLRKNLKSQP